MPNTTNYSLPYPASTAPPQVWVDMQALATATDTALLGVQDQDDQSVFSTTSVVPLVSAANTDTTVLTLSSFPFRQGFAYQIDWFWRFAVIGGTTPYAVFSKLKRASSSGTVIHDSSNIAVTGAAGNIFQMTGSVIVKCTVGNTTQTLVATQAYTTTGTPTSINISASSTAAARLTCRRIGFATDYTGALEIPTA